MTQVVLIGQRHGGRLSDAGGRVLIEPVPSAADDAAGVFASGYDQ
jgi:hypothetical protein